MGGANSTANEGVSLRRMVLVGMTGAGKSSSGNTILGRNCFEAAKSLSSVTKECVKEKGEVAGREIHLVDTPGMFHAGRYQLMKQQINSYVNMIDSGPHAIILVIKLDTFGRKERDSVQNVRAVFGEEADKYTIILFTHGDELTTSIEEYINEAGDDLKEVLRRCGGRYHVFNNKEKEDRTQVLELLEKVDDMVTANGGGYYTNDTYREAYLEHLRYAELSI